MPSSQPLEGKVAIVTGASRGIGLAVAGALLQLGAHVVGTSRTGGNADEAREQIKAWLGDAVDAPAAPRFDLRVADVRDYAEVERLVNEVAGEFGGVDILVNNAGIGAFAEVAAEMLEQWRETIDTNLTGVFHCCRAVVPHMKRRGGGWIVNISSLAAKNPFAGAAAYCASKAGLNAFS
jgi:NAD(P)-dependent dehydrogenase (short-subunit alcohol dehydrogenase family)